MTFGAVSPRKRDNEPWRHSAVSPARVLRRHPYDQRRDDIVDRWASGAGSGRSTSCARVGDASAKIVSGVTRRWRRSARRSRRMSAANTARSAHFRRTSDWYGAARRPHGAGRAARRPWWRTCDPAAGAAPAPALEDQIQQPQRHGGIMHGRWRSSITAGQRHVQHCGTPHSPGIPQGLLIRDGAGRPRHSVRLVPGT
jgi:hypothetical protein